MLRQALDRLTASLRRGTSHPWKKKPVRLEMETLELRWLPAVINIASATYSVSEATRYLNITIQLDEQPSNNITVDYATSNGSATAGSDYTAASGTVTFADPFGFGTYETTKLVKLRITDDDVSESDETFTVTISNPTGGFSLGSTTSTTITITNSSPGWTMTGQQRVSDTQQGFTQTFGTATYALQTTDLSVSHAFDFGRGGAVFAQPTLIYHSDTTHVRPIVQAVVTPVTLTDGITGMQARLTWNGGSAQSWVNFTQPGDMDKWIFGQQVSMAVSSTGLYSYTIDLVVNFSTTGSITRTVTGNAIVVVNDGAFGNGWNVSGFDKLVSVTGGMLYVYGNGGARLFTGSGPTYTSPANDQGTLVKNGDNTYTYTNKHQVDWNFDTSGKLTTITDPHGLSRTFTYDSGRLSTVAEADGGVTTFTYASGKLATIVQPGNRTITFTIDGSNNLTNIADADSSLRTFTYDANSDLTNEKWGLLNTTFTYNGTTELLTAINRGNGVTLTLDSPYGRSLSTTPPITQTDANVQYGKLYDALGRMGTFMLDTQGRFVEYRSDVGVMLISGYGYALDYGGGLQATIVRNNAGNITKWVDANSYTTTLMYDGMENLTNVIRPDSSRVTFTYDATFNFITSQKDSLNRLTTYTYNGTGDLTSIQNALSEFTTFTYTTGLVESVTNALNQITTYTYDGSRRLETIRDPLGNRTTLTYDSSGNIETVKDALSRVTTGTYDAKHRLLSVTNAQSKVTVYTYNAQGQLASVTDPLGVTTSMTYDAQGRNTLQVDAVGTALERTTTFAYDVLEQLSTVTNAISKVTTFSFTGNGWLQTETSPLSLTTTMNYDGEGQLLRIVNPLNQITTMTYNNRGWMETIRDALGNRTTFTYDTEGNKLTEKDANNGVTTYTYDALNRVIAVTDPLSHTVSVVYDAAGNISATIDALGNRTTFTYDANQQLTSVKNALNNFTTYTYDNVGNLTSVKDALSNVTTFVFDNLNRRINTVEPNGSTTTFMYDDNGQLTGLIDPNSNRTTFVYDALGRQTKEIDALNKTITYTYNAIDQLTQKKDRKSQTIDFTYDDAGRITGQVWKNSGGSTTNTVTYTYDNANRLLTASDGNGAYTFTYDAVGQVLTQKDMWGTNLTFTYDNVGNRTKVQDSLGGLETSTYDAANRLTSRKFSGVGSSSLRLDFTYTNANQMENIKRYNAASGGSLTSQTTFTYDNALRMSGIKNADGSASTLSHYTFTYDAANRLTTEVLGGSTTTFSYDVRSQLTGDGTASYGYDSAGNRNNNSQTITTGNRLDIDTFWDYSYDDEGNLTSKVSVAMPTVTWTYTWDVNNRLTAAVQSAGGNDLYEISYKYDVFGNRIEQTEDTDGDGGGASNVTTRFAWEGSTVLQNAWGNSATPIGTENWNIWADLSSGNALQTRYVRGDEVDQLFTRVKSNGDVAWYLTDRMGSVRQMLDATGSLENTITYDGFGNVINETDAAFGDRWKWTGREYNDYTGLQYNRARYYSGESGRWVSEDPIGFGAGDYNIHRYVSNSPSISTDPSGNQDRPTGSDRRVQPNYYPIEPELPPERPVSQPILPKGPDITVSTTNDYNPIDPGSYPENPPPTLPPILLPHPVDPPLSDLSSTSVFSAFDYSWVDPSPSGPPPVWDPSTLDPPYDIAGGLYNLILNEIKDSVIKIFLPPPLRPIYEGFDFGLKVLEFHKNNVPPDLADPQAFFKNAERLPK